MRVASGFKMVLILPFVHPFFFIFPTTLFPPFDVVVAFPWQQQHHHEKKKSA